MDCEYSHDLNERLKQWATLEYILLGDLRDVLEEPPSAETRRWLLAVLDALLDILPREIELKEADGYLSEVLDEFPNWAGLVDGLREEHDLLFEKLKELRHHIAGHTPFAAIAHEVRLDLREWMRMLTAHHRHETRLLQTAINLEVGCGD